MKGLNLALFDVEKAQLVPLVIKDGDDLDEYYRNLKCDTFDITMRRVGNTVFDIYCDDEGLLKPDYIVSALTSDLKPALVGNLIFAHHDFAGNTTSISTEDLNLLKRCVITAIDVQTGKSQTVLWGVDYL